MTGPGSDASRSLAADLRAAGVGDVDDSALTRSLYARDASLYRVTPQVVVRPRSSEEVLATLATAREHGAPLTSRGAGTSIAGNAVGPGVVLDFSRHLDRVLGVDPVAGTADVEPGTVHASLQRRAVALGRRFGPDPSTHTRCTVGGMIGNNACGSRALGYGRTSDNVEALHVALADGREFWTDRAPGDLAEALARLVDGHLEEVRTRFGRFTRQVSGYALEHLLPEHGRRLDRFLVGSEGTLAVVLGARVRLVEDAPARALAVLGYPDMACAADAVPALLAHPLVACEGLDERVVDVVRRRDPSAVPDLPPGHGWLFAEVTGEDVAQARALAERVAREAGVPARVVDDAREAAALWRVREDGAGLAARSLTRPAHAGWEDAAVPPERLGAYLRDFDALLRQHALDGVPYGHFGDGCVHVRIDFELGDDAGRRRFRTFLDDAADLTASHGGSLSGEHGDGRARSGLLPRMYDQQALTLFAQVKAVLDPTGMLNPGVLVDAADPGDDLALAGAPRRPPRTRLRLVHDDGDLTAAVHRCTGVGKCLAAPAAGGVMCPSFQATRDEKDSTRGRARVLAEMLDGRTLAHGWRDPAVHEALDLCLACKGCASDCPTGVDMATYKAEVLHQTYRRRLRPRMHYALGMLPRWARATQPVARLANAALRAAPLARAAKAAAGVDRRRGLPRLSDQPLRRWARAQGVVAGASGDVDVVVWADSFTDSFAADAGRAAVAVLRAAGQRVAVLDEPACCGLTWIATGQLDAAARIVGRAVDLLHPWVAAGVPVVGLEPSCLATLRSDTGELLHGDTARRAGAVAGGVRTLAEHLATLPDWQPPDLRGTRVMVQPHCHHASVLGFAADTALLARTGADVVTLGGCCGLAGSFGVEQGHYEASVAVAELQLLPAVRDAGPDAVLLADGFSCRTQVDDLVGRRAVHLAELLAGVLDRPHAVG